MTGWIRKLFAPPWQSEELPIAFTRAGLLFVIICGPMLFVAFAHAQTFGNSPATGPGYQIYDASGNLKVNVAAGGSGGGNAATDGSTTITSGGVAQNLFSGSTPTNGYMVCNPGTVDDLWVSDTTTAAANNTGSFRVALNGGCFTSPAGAKPIGAVSIVGATTGDKITARFW